MGHLSSWCLHCTSDASSQAPIKSSCELEIDANNQKLSVPQNITSYRPEAQKLTEERHQSPVSANSTYKSYNMFVFILELTVHEFNRFQLSNPNIMSHEDLVLFPYHFKVASLVFCQPTTSRFSRRLRHPGNDVHRRFAFTNSDKTPWVEMDFTRKRRSLMGK